MSEVKFLVGTKAQYDSVISKDENTLYFLNDTLDIMKGTKNYSSSVLFVTSLPESGQLQGKLYVDTNAGDGYTWNGSNWVKVISKIDVINDLTTGGTDKALSAEQGKVLKGQLDTHKSELAGSDAGHVKSGADVEISSGLITVKKINGETWESIKAGIDAEIAKKASLNGATFTGDVKLTGSPEGDTSAVSKKYVDDEVASKIAANDSMRFKGTIGTGGTITALPTSNVRVGDTYRVITAGTYAGAKCEIGDMIIALANKTSGSTDNNWTVVQANIDGAVVGPASATDSTVVLFDGATGKQIKGSTITLSKLTDTINKAHEHTNKETLDTYTKSMSDLKSEIESNAAQDATSKVNAAKEELQNSLGALKLTELADADPSLASATNGQVIYWDGSSKKWKAKTVAQVDISGKVDKMVGDTADHVVFANGSGGIKDSGKVVGGATLASSPNANTLATEAATKTYADSIQTVWEAIS